MIDHTLQRLLDFYLTQFSPPDKIKQYPITDKSLFTQHRIIVSRERIVTSLLFLKDKSSVHYFGDVQHYAYPDHQHTLNNLITFVDTEFNDELLTREIIKDRITTNGRMDGIEYFFGLKKVFSLMYRKQADRYSANINHWGY